MSSNDFSIFRLPTVMYTQICEFLKPEEVVALSLTCKFFLKQKLLSNNSLCKKWIFGELNALRVKHFKELIDIDFPSCFKTFKTAKRHLNNIPKTEKIYTVKTCIDEDNEFILNFFLNVVTPRAEVNVVESLKSKEIDINFPLSLPLYFPFNHSLTDFLLKLRFVDSGYIHKKQTPLFFACLSQNFKMVKLLVERGANVNFEDQFKKTPFHFAILSATDDSNLEICQFLLDSGANVNACDEKDRTALHLVTFKPSINEKVVKFLLINGAKVNSFDDVKNTPLHGAAQSKNLKVCQMLLEHGASINALNNQDKTPLHYALSICFNESVTLKFIDFMIKNNALINTSDIYGVEPILSIFYFASSNALLSFINYGATTSLKACEKIIQHYNKKLDTKKFQIILQDEKLKILLKHGSTYLQNALKQLLKTYLEPNLNELPDSWVNLLA